MPKTAYLAKHLSSSEIKEKYLQSQDSVETRRWHLVDEPLVNQYFEREECWGFPSLFNHAVETINQIEDILVERCCVVSEMKDDVCKLTNYHWL